MFYADFNRRKNLSNFLPLKTWICDGIWYQQIGCYVFATKGKEKGKKVFNAFMRVEKNRPHRIKFCQP